MNKKILGLDLGTNSIGWGLIERDNETKKGKILGMGSRIIPMGAELSKFEQGQAQTKNANRRIARGARKLNKRYKQRRNKLLYILQQLDMLPEQIKLSEPFSNPLKLDRISILPIAKKQKQYSALDLLELRVKALTQPISLKELGRIIYLFNQLRGYSGGGNDSEQEEYSDDESENEVKKGKDSYIVFGKVLSISEPEIIIYKGKERKKSKITLETEDGTLQGDTFLDILKIDESLELLVSISSSKKYGETLTFKLPNKTNWRQKMENLEKELIMLSKEKGKEIYLSEYFLSILKENKWVKVRNNVILRSRYQAEFDAIWEEQAKYHDVLSNISHHKLTDLLKFIFPGFKETQEKYRHAGLEKGLYHVIRNQIIYHQRELKDQTHLISYCRFEKSEKAIAKSHPIFQEFRIWEQINKLTINTKTENGINRKGEIKYKYVDKPLPSALKEWLFDELHEKKEVGFGVIFNKLKKEYGLRDGIDFLNGMNHKAKLKGNETKLILKKALGEQLWNTMEMAEKNKQIELWDILYNAKGNEYYIESERTSKVLSFIKKYINNISDSEETAIKISKIKFSRNYALLSLKAIDKILPIVRCGKYFDYNLSGTLQAKIIRLVNEHVSDPFEKAAQEYLENNVDVLLEGGIMNAYATILVYDKHTSKEYSEKDQIKNFQEVKRLIQGELRNPLVEQLISEALMMVKDIWKEYGKPHEIRLELARELKNNAERRAKIYKVNNENQKTNEEVKNLLIELNQEITLTNIEKYKLWVSQENLKEEFVNQIKDPSKSEIEKMKLWREQGHVSPYTGQPIPLSELFNRERYDVDHIIPQSRYFDNSFTNKIICEKYVNKDKGNRTTMEYFETGSTIPSVLSKTKFIELVNKLFQGIKRKNLLATKVPEDPIARQMKETQYISVRIKEELNKIVGNENVKTTTGGITDYLRNQWGLTDKFKSLLKGRYEQVQPIVAELEYGNHVALIEKKKLETKESAIQFTNTELSKEQFIESFNRNYFQKKNNKLIIKGWSKRIDHRHHAIDALVIACTEPAHVKLLNDLNKELQTWLDEHRKELLPDFEGSPSELLDEILNLDENTKKKVFLQIKKFREIEMPWKGFAEDVEEEIQKIVISQKPKDKLLIQPQLDRNGNLQEDKLQIKIRGQLHEGTLYGKSQGIEAYRIPLSKLSGKQFATEKTIEKIANEYLKIAVKEHLKEFDNKKEEAFSVEGILSLNKKLAEKKNKKGKLAPHTPISSIKVFYRDPSKIKNKKGKEQIEEALQKLDRKKAFNKSLFVKTGDNYLFAVMERDNKRVFDLITFYDAANLLKEKFNIAKDKTTFKKELVFKKYFEEENEATRGAKLLFTLKQGDAVYMPSEGEDIISDTQSPFFKSFWEDKAARSKNIQYVTKYSGKQIYFIKHNIADPILKGKEFGSQNAYEMIDNISVKQHCIKLNIDRLGNIKPA